ncbi:MAG: hypothetical protein ABSH48_16385 [Verrucomicrobiota bacterium]|jgi:photosystem II stability/assembly factor-like uncharacterized protein
MDTARNQNLLKAMGGGLIYLSVTVGKTGLKVPTFARKILIVCLNQMNNPGESEVKGALAMKPKLALCLAIASCAVLSGRSTINDRPAALSNATAVGTYIAQIHMIDARNGWAWSRGDEIGNLLRNTLLLHTSDGARTWQDRTPRAFPYIAEGGCFLDSQTAWVSTLDRKESYRGGLLRTTDGGKSWSVLIPQGTASYGRLTESSDCNFSNAHDGVANIADYSAGSRHVCFYETHDGGKDWKPVVIIPPGGRYPNEPPGTIGLSDITPETMGFCPPANVIITHGDMDDEEPKEAVHLSVSTNLGNNWRKLNLPLPTEKYRDGLVTCDTPVFPDGKNGWLPVHIVKYGAGYTIAWNVLAFYTTSNGGETWTPRPGIIVGGTNLVGGYGQINLVSIRDIFVHGGANLYVTHDGAKSWQTIKPNLDLDRTVSRGGVLQIDFVDSKHGWALVYDTLDYSHNQYHVYKTSGGGATWAELPLKIGN